MDSRGSSVGDAELAVLRGALDRTQSGHGQLVALVGDPHHSFLGEITSAIEPGERARDITRGLGDVCFQAEANQRLALVYEALGDLDRAIALSRETLALLTPERARSCWTGPNLTSVLARWMLGWYLATRGVFSEAIALTEEAFGIAETVTNSDSLVLACTGAGIVHLFRGDTDRAISRLERAVENCQTSGVMVFLPLASAYLGSARALAGRVADGISLLERGAAGAATWGPRRRARTGSVRISFPIQSNRYR